MKDYFVYILANKPRGTLYVGGTSDLVRRVYEHREGAVPGFIKRYGLKQLVHFEKYDNPTTAIQREKNIKHCLISSPLQTRSGAISIPTSLAERPHGCPGQARA
jgi:putative endonuclease